MDNHFVPSVPMLHTSYLGPHVESFGVDGGSFAHQLTCDALGKDHSVTIHPNMIFDQPISQVHATMKTQNGETIWDAIFNTAGGKEIPSTAPPVGGMKPVWPRICNEPGKVDIYNVSLKINDGINTSAQFIADHRPRHPSAVGQVSSDKDETGVVRLPFSPIDLLPPASSLF